MSYQPILTLVVLKTTVTNLKIEIRPIGLKGHQKLNTNVKKKNFAENFSINANLADQSGYA